MLTAISRAGSALLSALLEGNWNIQPALYAQQPLGRKLSGNLPAAGKFTLRTTTAHATLSPTASWQDARETPANSKGTFARLLIALQSLCCHLLAVKQGPEETRDSSHIRLHLVTSFVIYHVDKLFKKFSCILVAHPCTSSLSNLNGDCALNDAESTSLQRSTRHVATQRPLTTRGGDEIIAHTLTRFVAHGIKIA